MRMSLAGLVQQAYPSPEWAVFFEVSNATGFGASRRADAIALGVWPSRGHTLLGFEFKEDRRDWLRELKNPAKADVIAAHCDAWIVVAGHLDIVKLEELPEPWGLMVASEGRTRLLTKKAWPVFAADRDRSSMQRSFVAAMLRKVSETTVHKSEIERRIQEAVTAATERTGEGAEVKNLRQEVEKLRGIIDTFQAETGVNLCGYKGPQKIAAAVNAVLHLDVDRRDLETSARRLEMAAVTMREALAAWPEKSLVS